MNIFETIKTDVEAIAKNAGAGLEKMGEKVEADVLSLEERLKAYIDEQIATIEAKIVGVVEAAPSTALADLEKVVASIAPAVLRTTLTTASGFRHCAPGDAALTLSP